MNKKPLGIVSLSRKGITKYIQILGIKCQQVTLNYMKMIS